MTTCEFCGVQRSGFYVASKVKYARMWRSFRDSAGAPIISTWIDEAGEGETADYVELATRCQSEISRSEAVILYCEQGDVLKGALIEVGMALAMGVPVYCIGACESLSRVFAKHPLWHGAESAQGAIDAAREKGGAK